MEFKVLPGRNISCFALGDCSIFPCRNNARCENNGDSFICHCTEDYKGITCEQTKGKRQVQSVYILHNILVLLQRNCSRIYWKRFSKSAVSSFIISQDLARKSRVRMTEYAKSMGASLRASAATNSMVSGVRKKKVILLTEIWRLPTSTELHMRWVAITT